MFTRTLALFKGDNQLKDLPILLGIMAALFVVSRYNYLLFHSLVEAAMAAMSFTAFALAWNSRNFSHGYLLLLGLSYGFIAGLGVLHTLAFKGMGVFPSYGPDLATQLWIASRYLTALILLFAPFYLKRTLPLVPAVLVLSLTTASTVTAIFLGYFPVCFVDGVGLTPFKIVSEYIISGLLIVALGLFLRCRQNFDSATLKLMVLYFVFSIACGLVFTSYFSVFDYSNLVGHYLLLLSTYFFYKAIVEKGLRQPLELLFRDLQQAVHSRDEFISIAAHELKTPLTPLRLQLQNFQRLLRMGRAAELSPEKVDRTILISIKQIDRMTYLIDSLMDATRISLGKLEVSKAPFDLAALVREVADRHSPELQAARNELTFDLSEGCTFNGDAARLDQVISNLLLNASKYAPGSQVSIGLKHTEGNLLWVEDNGPGIPAEARGRIFGRYERLNQEHRSGGLGLGLFISRQIVEAHGGTLRLASKPGTGCRFEIRLP